MTLPLAGGRGRVFTPDSEGNVWFSKADNPIDWNQDTNDAGFIPGAVGKVTALGVHNKQLLVFGENAIAVWSVASDPAGFALDEIIEGEGCLPEHAGTVALVGGNAMWRGPGGYRMLGTERETERTIVREVGSPIDAAVQEREAEEAEAGVYQRAVYSAVFDQYLCFRSPHRADVFSFSRDDRVAAWSEYRFDEQAVGWPVARGGALYFRRAEAAGQWGGVLKMDFTTARLDGQQLEAAQEVTYGLGSRAERDGVFDLPPGGQRTIGKYWLIRTAPRALPASTGGSANGPGPANRTDFVAWAMDPVVETPDDTPYLQVSLTAAAFGTGTARRRFDLTYNASGGLWGAGWHVEVVAVDAQGAEKTFDYLYGWASQRSAVRKGDTVVDAAGQEWPVALDGGWVQRTIEVPEGTASLLLRTPFTRPAPSGLALRAQFRPGLDGAFLCFAKLVRDGSIRGASDPAEVQLAYLDAKRPGIAKIWDGVRVSQEGTSELSYRYREAQALSGGGEGVLERETGAVRLSGEGMGGDLVPVEMVAKETSPVLRPVGSSPWTLGGLSLEFRALNAWG